MRTAIITAILCATTGMCSCGLYSKYERPEIPFTTETTTEIDSTEHLLSNLSWRQLFNDSILISWIEIGLERNTDLQAALLRTEAANATLSASKLAMLPSVNLTAQGSVSDSRNSFTVGPSAQWEIDIFGKQRNLRLEAQAGLQSAEAYKQAVQTSLIASIASGYYTLLMLDEQLSISLRTIKTWDENIRVLQALKRAGRTNEAAVLQARANRLKVENSALTLKRQISEQENALRSLLLTPEMDMTRLTLASQEFPDTLSSGIPLSVLSNRPDVRAAEYDLMQTFYHINVARAAFYPSLTLSGNVGWTTESGNAVGNPSSWITNALGSVVAPLFTKGTNRANLTIAKTDYEKALLTYQQTLVNAGMQVNNALTAWQTAQQRLAIDKKQIVALKGAVHNTRLLMRNTNTNYLEVLTAQQRLLEAELTEANDRYDAIDAIIDLYHASGGGVD